jgi:photosystem II stability/assembly factor-like uncharacterized protein
MPALTLSVLLVSVWVRLPGPQGAACQSVDVNPQNHRTLLCCTWHGAAGGVYRSTDCGLTWAAAAGIPKEQGYGANIVRFCPADTALAYCGTKVMGTNGLYRSDDGGRTWQPTAFPVGYAEDITFAPGSDDTVFVVTGTGLVRTTDRGASWTEVFHRTYCWCAEFRPGSDETLFVGGYNGLYRSFDRGLTWDTCGFGGPCYDFVFDPSAPDTFYIAAHTRGVFKVWNLGDSWDSLGMGNRYNTVIAIDSARRELYSGGFAYGPIPGRICRSTDMGGTWQEFGPHHLYDLVCNELCVPQNDTVVYAAGNYFGVQRYSRRDSIWHQSEAGLCEANVRAIAVSQADVVYTSGSVMGLSHGTKYGQLWQTLVDRPVCGLPHESEMLPPGLAVSRTHSDSVYAAFWGYNPPCQSVFASGDAGITWREARVPDLRPSDQLNTLTIHPRGSDTLYLASQRGPFKSTDAGATWTLLDTVLCYHVAVDPHAPATVYASGMLTLRRSTDAGATWQDFSSGLSPNSEVMMVEPDPESAGVLYAALCGGEMQDPLSGVYVFRPSAGQWQRKSSGLPGRFMIRPRVAFDVTHGCIWAIVPNQDARVYRSFDRGETWLAADSGLATYMVYFIACGRETYLGTRGDGIWQWTDAPGVGSGSGAWARRARGVPTVVSGAGLPPTPGAAAAFDCCGRMVRGSGQRASPGVYFLVGGRGIARTVRVR